MAQRYGIMPTEYLASRTRGQFLNDVGAWQTTFLAPMHVVAKALGAGKPDDGTEQSPDGPIIRSRIPGWHRKSGERSGTVVWDLDNDHIAERALMGSAPISEDGVTFDNSWKKNREAGDPIYEAVKRYGIRR